MNDTVIDQESVEVFRLRKKHADLDEQIKKLRAAPGSDDLEIVELKKQKLRLKDEIARLAS